MMPHRYEAIRTRPIPPIRISMIPDGMPGRTDMICALVLAVIIGFVILL
jgi:hypothetical protein